MSPAVPRWTAAAWRGLQAARGLAIRLGVALVVAALAQSAGSDRLDHAVTDLRFALWHRPPTGRIVVVDIDEASLTPERGWPWSRAVHAAILDRLLALDADTVAFDVDFSAETAPAADAAFEAALTRAGDSVILAALHQPDTRGAGGRGSVDSLPLPRFAAHAWPASVNQWPDADGRTRAVPRSEPMGGARLPSLAMLVAAPPPGPDEPFLVDFGIDEAALRHVSVDALLGHCVAREAVAGRIALVGATALQLKDDVAVPRFDSIPGVALHAMAAESLMQGRALRPLWKPLAFGAAALGLLAAALLARGRRLGLQLAVLAGAAVVGEALAVALQSALPLEPGTAPLHAGLLCFGLLAVGTEIESRRVNILRSRAEADRLRTILNRVIADNFAGVVVVDHDGTVRAISAAAAAIVGLPAGVEGHPRFDAVLPGPLAAACTEAMTRAADGTWWRRPVREIQCTLADGRRVTLDCVATPSRIPGPVGSDGRPGPERHAVCLSFADVTEQRAAEARLVDMARRDALTGLANRRVLIEGIEAALAEAAGRAQAGGAEAPRPVVALLVLDLARFKVVNDRLGHSNGDALLVAVAGRLSACAAPGDLAARLGGDEFALLVARPSIAEVRATADGIVAAVGRLHTIGPYEASVGVSLGIALAEGGEAAALMRGADAARAVARRQGGDRAVLYDADMARAAEEERALEHDLRDGLARGEFWVVYQRQVDLATDRVVGVEALVRWRHPTRGPVSPAVFIPIAERTGVIDALGAFVLRTACRDAVAWPLPIRVSVNLSALQLQRDDLVATVLEALAASGLPPARLDLELTESLLMENDGPARDRLDRLRAAGIHLALDDFGTGYSSLSYLRDFPIDKIKIDQSFVRGLPGERPAAAIIEAVVSLAGSLGLRVNAEGCETADQVEALRRLGCDEVQGWYHGRPEPAEAIAASLAAQRGAEPALEPA